MGTPDAFGDSRAVPVIGRPAVLGLASVSSFASDAKPKTAGRPITRDGSGVPRVVGNPQSRRGSLEVVGDHQSRRGSPKASGPPEVVGKPPKRCESPKALEIHKALGIPQSRREPLNRRESPQLVGNSPNLSALRITVLLVINCRFASCVKLSFRGFKFFFF